MSNWDWSNSDDLAVQSVRGIAVYTNTKGDIVIRQQGEYGEEDSIVIFPKSLAGSVANAIVAESEIVG